MAVIVDIGLQTNNVIIACSCLYLFATRGVKWDGLFKHEYI